MITARIGLVGGALLLFTASAFAFQQQPAGSPAPAQTSGQPSAEQSKPGTNLSASDAAGSKSGGTEVSIPGLGKLGVLPKMDFGLELLYGASEGKQPDPQQQREDGRDELTIRGSVKHKF